MIVRKCILPLITISKQRNTTYKMHKVSYVNSLYIFIFFSISWRISPFRPHKEKQIWVISHLSLFSFPIFPMMLRQTIVPGTYCFYHNSTQEVYRISSSFLESSNWNVSALTLYWLYCSFFLPRCTLLFLFSMIFLQDWLQIVLFHFINLC